MYMNVKDTKISFFTDLVLEVISLTLLIPAWILGDSLSD